MSLAELWVVTLAGMWVGAGAEPPASQPASQPTVQLATQAASQPAVQLMDEMVRAYFLEDDAERRRELAVAIEEMEGVGVDEVAAAIRGVCVWEPAGGRKSSFVYETPDGAKRTVHVVLPACDGDAPDPHKAYPLLLCLPVAGVGSNEPAVGLAPLHLFEHLAADPHARPEEQFIVASVQKCRGAAFDAPLADSREPVRLLREIRRRFHVDTDRVFLFGQGHGATDTLSMAVLYTHWVAGLVSFGGSLDVPYPQPMYDILLPNLMHTPALVIWLGEDGEDREQAPRAAATTQSSQRDDVLSVLAGEVEGFSLAYHDVISRNRLLVAEANRLRLPVAAIEHEESESREAPDYKTAFDGVMDHRRDPSQREVSHWFRYPAQGRIGWLLQRGFDGEPWQSSQISILSAPTTDFYTYATEVLKSKLAYIGGRIEGQTITIETTRTTHVELRLGPELIDLTQPIEIIWNGRKRVSVLPKPKIATMLEIAYEDWEFKHLYPVRLILSEKGFTRQG